MLTFALVLALATLLALLASVAFMASMATDFAVLVFALFVGLFATGLIKGLRGGSGSARLPAGKGSSE